MAKSARVALLTPASVACAESTTATSSVKAFTCSSSPRGSGWIACSRRKNSATSASPSSAGRPERLPPPAPPRPRRGKPSRRASAAHRRAALRPSVAGPQSAVSRVFRGSCAAYSGNHDGRQPESCEARRCRQRRVPCAAEPAPVARPAWPHHPVRLHHRRLYADIDPLLSSGRAAHRRLHRARRPAALDRLPRVQPAGQGLRGVDPHPHRAALPPHQLARGSRRMALQPALGAAQPGRPRGIRHAAHRLVEGKRQVEMGAFLGAEEKADFARALGAALATARQGPRFG